MEYKIAQYSIWEIGHRTDPHGHPLQEDSIYPPLGQGRADDRLFMVCDGMGANGAGLLASATVCQAISDYFKRINPKNIGVDSIKEAIDSAYDALDHTDFSAYEKKGTTLALLALTDCGYFTAHIGDSRVYQIRPGQTAEDTKIVFCTCDHSLVNYLVRKGKMTPQEALTSPKRHVITRSMLPNMERRCYADMHTSADVRAGDYFMLCSDGMLEGLTDDNIRAIFSAEGGNAKNKAGLLAKFTSDNSDNHSAIIVQITEVTDSVKPASKPAAVKPQKRDNMSSKTMAQSASKVKSDVRDFVTKHKEKGDVDTLLIKFLLILMGLLAAIMLIYYLFIRSNETLQAAGTAVDDIPSYEEVEEYGYEITEQDKRNEAQQIAPEVEEVSEDITIIDPETLDAPTPESLEPERPAPETHTDEPILQE